MAWIDMLTPAQIRNLPANVRQMIFGSIVSTINKPSLASSVQAPLNAITSAVESAAPALGVALRPDSPPQAAYTAMPLVAPAASVMTSPTQYTPPAPPAPQVVQIAAPVLPPPATPSEEAQKRRAAIKVSDSTEAVGRAAAAIAGGDSGLQIDPLGRRGRGYVGRAAMLGR